MLSCKEKAPQATAMYPQLPSCHAPLTLLFPQQQDTRRLGGQTERKCAEDQSGILLLLLPGFVQSGVEALRCFNSLPCFPSITCTHTLERRHQVRLTGGRRHLREMIRGTALSRLKKEFMQGANPKFPLLGLNCLIITCLLSVTEWNNTAKHLSFYPTDKPLIDFCKFTSID